MIQDEPSLAAATGAPRTSDGLLAGKKVLVTGGSRGIGAGIVRAATHEGAEVAFLYRSRRDEAEALTRELSTAYPERTCVALQCDVTDGEATRAAVRSVVETFGHVDMLVNNAGITRDASFGRMTREQWDDVISTNLGGMFNATQPLILQFVKQRAGAIVNLTSTAGIFGSGNQTNYAASKAGIIGFTRALSKEVAPLGVRVNAVAPGFIDTEMVAQIEPDRLRHLRSLIPAGRLGTTQDVADVVCFLGSDRAMYITGQVIQVDGGLVL